MNTPKLCSDCVKRETCGLLSDAKKNNWIIKECGAKLIMATPVVEEKEPKPVSKPITTKKE